MKKTCLISICCLIVVTGFADVSTPSKVLPDGVDKLIAVNPYTGQAGEARKGTIAATLNNIARLNILLAEEQTEAVKGEINQIVEIIDGLIPSLEVIGMFDMFTPDEWFGDGKQLGRVLVLSLYLNHYPNKANSTLSHKLEVAKGQNEPLNKLLVNVAKKLDEDSSALIR